MRKKLTEALVRKVDQVEDGLLKRAIVRPMRETIEKDTAISSFTVIWVFDRAQ